MKELKVIIKDFYDSGAWYRFIRDNGDRYNPRVKQVKVSDLSKASVKRIERILGGSLTKRINENIYTDHVCLTYSIVDRPYYMAIEGVKIYQNLYGNLVIEVSKEVQQQIAEDLESNEFEYPSFDEYFDEFFCVSCGGDFEYYSDLGDAGIAMFSGMGIVLPVELSEDNPAYDEDRVDNYNCKLSKLWAFDHYAIEHPFDVLAREGKVTFTYAPNYDED